MMERGKCFLDLQVRGLSSDLSLMCVRSDHLRLVRAVHKRLTRIHCKHCSDHYGLSLRVQADVHVIVMVGAWWMIRVNGHGKNHVMLWEVGVTPR